MIRLTFLWEAESYYSDEDEDIGPVELETYYVADTWQEACDDSADCYDWDDEDVINFDAESDLQETSRSLSKILITENDKEEKEADTEIYEYYNEAEQKAMGL
ncbi:MAG: hypothetical protein CXT73_01840 [Methanobacteriota archaeon]|jgi:hypothetical protein|nr:MAG: hypothetical protein CXT73_01840 [Euryarchaeota archaeon]